MIFLYEQIALHKLDEDNYKQDGRSAFLIIKPSSKNSFFKIYFRKEQIVTARHKQPRPEQIATAKEHLATACGIPLGQTLSAIPPPPGLEPCNFPATFLPEKETTLEKKNRLQWPIFSWQIYVIRQKISNTQNRKQSSSLIICGCHFLLLSKPERHQTPSVSLVSLASVVCNFHNFIPTSTWPVNQNKKFS